MGTIKYIGKTITESSASMVYSATKGRITLNACKDVILQAKHKVKYDRYESFSETIKENKSP
ncbi:hypothetical protein [Pedobacter kyungheensis]|uniref:hypothetical protein n=1 Tax=Pedobacter kyungheensis TaxID=1069985 RepID=UPI000B146844|nr:hypothetical protein [Pedobacter kyungheensis]